MLKDKLYADIITAMKSGDSLKKEALKMVKAEIMKFEVSGAEMIADDEKVLEILGRAVKQRKEAAEGFTQGGNTEAAEKEMQEAAIYAEYLPEQMGEEEVKKIVEETIAEVGAAGPSDMGKVMGAIMPKVKGKADGGLVKQLVQSCLNE
ncbi:MAG: GatB/YqeY domain-containing protein [Candidatus Gracilibacteria bacterium]|nr:GatB/YqeY domain-containing protein [Candidatus Gracilibacteria bacterium]